jgi:hypothetical protein
MSTSTRLDYFGDVLERHLGKRARREAGPILLELLRGYYVVVHLGELPPARADAGLVLRIATELERACDDESAARIAATSQADEIAGAAGIPPRVY